MRRAILFIVFLMIFVGCRKSDQMPQELLAQQLVVVNFGCKELTKSSNVFEQMQGACVVADKDGRLIEEIFADFDMQSGTLTIEPLYKGRYQLGLMLYDRELLNCGFSVNTPRSLSDNWLEFTGESMPLMERANVFHKLVTFEVDGDQNVVLDVTLDRVMSSLNLEIAYPNYYVERSMTDVTIRPRNNVVVASSMSVDKQFSGGVPISTQPRSLMNNPMCYVMPAPSGSPCVFEIMTTTTTFNNTTQQYGAYRVNATLNSGELSIVSANLKDHPDANLYTQWVSRKVYDSKPRELILQDGESPDLYFNENHRTFNVKEMVQKCVTEQNELQVRSYVAKPILNAKIWAKIPSLQDEIEIAIIDSIPAFSDFYIDLPQYDAQNPQYIKTSNGSRVKLTQRIIEELKGLTDKIYSNSSMRFESEDEIAVKLNSIIVSWRVKFWHFGANYNDPNPDTGRNGNWVAIKPVHMREAAIVFSNLAYIFSTKEFADFNLTLQGLVRGNGYTGEVDMSTIVRRSMNFPLFTLGVCWSVAGLGGGSTLGLEESAFINHYQRHFDLDTFFHEFGHCLGYNDASDMTYGVWPDRCATYALNQYKDKKLIISERDYMKTYLNRNLYQYYSRPAAFSLKNVSALDTFLSK